ncbi:polysaccharide deacetylase family protein [Aurantiacibacter suaedae]|uniref:polysaccharide deacetylase family protein n=1 Tax=Aurantiacibacter suaedae TaxID=2545755 RepID=UPI0010F63E7F|nr:hypothetical protein [Aurantiacibacter suaedae]
MTNVLITIDTEYSAGMVARKGVSCRAENFARSISCETESGSVGIAYQMDRFDRHGLKGVFFVDPMPGLVWGAEAIADVVEPIVSRGHEVQLHLHPEWLQFAGTNNPLGQKTGRNIKDFPFEEQCILLSRARDILVAAGAPRPTAFRAGNYGADDDTLRALCEIGIPIDTSHCPGIARSDCEISLGSDTVGPLRHHGTIEMPIGCIEAARGATRHCQLTALSAREILAASKHARDTRMRNLIVVSHSFELLSRDRSQVNSVVKRRFDKVCEQLASLHGVATCGFTDIDTETALLGNTTANPLPHKPLRTFERLVEQSFSNLFYGRA